MIFFTNAKAAMQDRFSKFPFLNCRIPHFESPRKSDKTSNCGAGNQDRRGQVRWGQFPNQIPPARPSRLYPDSVGALREPSAFTLVELMAVVGIVALLAVVGAPAIKGLTGSGGRKQALAQVMGALEVARNTAISTGTNAAVIFPDASFSPGGSSYQYRSMAIVAWSPTNPALQPTMLGSWITLPQGITFFPNSLGNSAMPTITAAVRILTTTYSNNIFPAIVFQYDGGLWEGNALTTNPTFPTNGVAFFEGTIGEIPTDNNKKFETVQITRFTGRARPTLAPAP
jgi:hypothetical protein